MFGWMKSNNDTEDRLLNIMKKNRQRVTVSPDGVIRINFKNKEVLKKIQQDMKILKELEEM